MRGLFNATFKSNPFMERGLLTGITRVSKESIFSDLNNLTVVTTTSEKYSTQFRFTQDEVFHALQEYGMLEYYTHPDNSFVNDEFNKYAEDMHKYTFADNDTIIQNSKLMSEMMSDSFFPNV